MQPYTSDRSDILDKSNKSLGSAADSMPAAGMAAAEGAGTEGAAMAGDSRIVIPHSFPPALTVVVAFFNAEATLERTLESLAAQTPPDVEYLFVDDGSTDGSARLLQQFIDSHPDFSGRHRLISSPQRRGIAHASAVGLNTARGEYVMRCDADDYLEPDALERLLAATDCGKIDIVMAPYILEEDGHSREVSFAAPIDSLNDMPIDTLHFALWNKLLRRSLLTDNGIALYEGINYWEDLGIVSRAMAMKPTVAIIDRPVYHYTIAPHGCSLTHAAQDIILEQRLDMSIMLQQWFIDRELDRTYADFLDNMKFFAKIKMLRGPQKDVRRWKSTYPEVNARIMSLRHLSWGWRLVFKAVALLPAWLTQWVADISSRRKTC